MDTVDTSPSGMVAYESGEAVDPQTLQFRRAIGKPEQAHSICKRLNQENNTRNIKNAAIMRKYNDEPPWDSEKLRADGQGWRHNRSTGFLSSMVKRIMPPYDQIINTAKVLTSSKLTGDNLDNERKEEVFQFETTRLIRRWKGWKNHVYQTTLENIMFGSAINCWTDEFEWRPKFARTDMALFPRGCPQDADDVPLWCLKESFLIHELADKLIEPEISAQAGWDIDKLVEAINNASPETLYDASNPRKFEDIVRETGIGMSFSLGVNVIEVFHLFIRETTGSVSHFITHQKSGDLLFKRLDRFSSMEQCLSLFTIEVGNGKLHGSKGAGRILYNTHVGIEQARNLIADNLYLSGLILLKVSEKGKKTAALQVTHPVALIGEQYEVIDSKFPVDTDAFFKLDKHMTTIAEMQVGAFMPGQMNDDDSGEKRTASEVNYVASIEQQIRESLLTRWYDQVQFMIHEMQRRVYSISNVKTGYQLFAQEQVTQQRQITADMQNFLQQIYNRPDFIPQPIEKNYDEEAVECIIELMRKGLTPEDIYEMGQCPPMEVTMNLKGQDPQAIDMVVTRYRGDTSVDQQKLKSIDISSKLGSDRSDDLIIPAEDNTLQAEATRMQLLELTSLMQGEPMPVSPRDVDTVHMDVIQQASQKLFSNLQAVTPQTLPLIKGVMVHYDAHLQQALPKAKPGTLQPYVEFSKKVQMVLQKTMDAMSGQPGQNGVQPPNGAIPAVAAGHPGLASRSSHAGKPAVPAGPAGQTISPLPPQPTPPVVGHLPLANGPVDTMPRITPQ